MKIIPAIDIINNECVRLTQGDYNRSTSYNMTPLDMAFQYEDAGINHLHVVDLVAAKTGQFTSLDTIEKICKQTTLIVDYGGGIRSIEQIQQLIDIGVSQVTLGSVAITNKKIVSEALSRFGAERIILGADSREGMIQTDGWTQSSTTELQSFLQYYEKAGVESTIVTDINKDGMLEGPAIELYQNLIASSSLNIIASGGVHNMQCIEQLDDIGCYAVIIGKAIYEGNISLKELSALC